MIISKALALGFAGLLYGTPVPSASASVGALQQSVSQVASDAYLNGNFKLTKAQQKDFECLSKVVWYEARGESKLGKTMVANVVQNRTQYGKPFATTICQVVYQKNQFAWTRNKSKKNSTFKQVVQRYSKTDQKHLDEVAQVAMHAVLFPNSVKTTATHFCSIGEKCNFGRVAKLGKVGGHTFFEYLGNRS